MENIDITLLNKELVWITLINGGYIHYTKNFLMSMQKANIQFKLIILCLDTEAFSNLNHTPNCICVMVNFLSGNLPQDMKRWGELDYKKIVYAKLDAIAYALKYAHHMGIKAVGYIDTDIYLWSDPTSVMLSEMQLYPDVDIFCQCDEQSITCSDRNKCLNLCSGVFVVRTKEGLTNLFTYEESDIHKHYSDQHYLHDKLNTLSIRYRTIEKHIMPNGGYYNALYNYPSLQQHKIPIDPSVCLIHFNYMVGNTKKESMKIQGLWLV